MKSELKIGITFLLALVSLFIAIFFIKDIQFDKDGQFYVVRFDFLDNLMEGSHVKLFGGIRIGTVVSLYHTERYANVKIIINDSTINKLIKHKRPDFSVNSTGLLGEQYLLISFNEVKYTDEIQTTRLDGEDLPLFVGERSKNIGALIAKIDNAVTRIDKEIIGEISIILQEVKMNIQRKEVKEIIVNLAKASRNLNKVLVSTDGTVKDFRTKVDESLIPFALESTKTLSKINKLITLVNDIAENITDEKKPIGGFLKDDKMGSDLKKIISNIEELTEELKTHPLIINKSGKQGPY